MSATPVPPPGLLVGLSTPTALGLVVQGFGTSDAPEVLPVPHPVDDCMYCWYLLHPDEPFPARLSSTVCEPHAELEYAKYQRLRVARAARAAQQPGRGASS